MGSEISKGALKNFPPPPQNSCLGGGVGRNNEIMTQMSWHENEKKIKTKTNKKNK